MKRVAIVFFLSGLAGFLALGLSGCGGSNSTQPIAIGLTSSVAGNAIDQAQIVSITASVRNDPSNAGVQWRVSGGGTLSGQTTSTVTYNAPASVTTAFTATITATSITDATRSATLQVKVNPLPAITTSSLAAGTAGTYYSATLSESGGTSPYKWTVTSGTLPVGLSLSISSGALTGTPTGASSGSVTFQVADAAGMSASEAITVTMHPPPTLTITTASLPQGSNGTPYNQTLQSTGGVPSYTWSVTAGSLPPGLNLSTTGVISGTPTGTITATSNFTVTVTDSQTPAAATASAGLSITVIEPPLSVTTTSLAGGSIGNAYNQALQAIGGTPPYTWSILVDALPSGLALNATSGIISGTPTTAGTTGFTVQVTDSTTPTRETATANLSITINAALAITTMSLPGGSIGTAYSSTVQASGGAQPYTWSVSSGTLPAGLAVNAESGTISGTPTALGTSTFTVTVADSESPSIKANATLSITIASASCPNNSSLSGQYALLLNGWSSAATAASIVGSFSADGNGNVSSGLLDIADQASSSKPQSGRFTGTYCVNSKNLATINLTYGGGLSGGHTFAAALDSSDNNGHIISYDNSTLKISGLLRKQTPSAFATSKIDGNYAFGIIGVDQGANRFGMAGEFNSNGSGTLAGEYDSNDGGVTQVAQTLSASDFSVASTGRATATITSGYGNTNFVFYVVSPSEMLMMAFDTTEAPPVILAGQVLQQSGSYTDASLDGVSVIELQSLGGSESAPTARAGLLTTTGNLATYTLGADQNQGGTMSTQSDSGTYSVASNGRVKLTSSGGGGEPIFYLVAKNQAFAIGVTLGVDFGAIDPQTGSNFTNASLSGNYLGGSQPPQSANVSEAADYLNSNGDDTLSGMSDTNGSAGPQSATISTTYVVSSSGRVVVSQGGIAVAYMYIISDSEVVSLPVSSSQNQNGDPALLDLNQ